MISEDSGPVRCTVPSHPRYLPLVRAFVQEGAALAGFGADLTQHIGLAVTEAVTNVIRHAYEGETGRPIDLALHARAGRMELEIVDYGRFVDPDRIESRPLEDVRPGGLGVHLIRSTMDRVEYRQNEHGGTTLRLVKDASASEGGS